MQRTLRLTSVVAALALSASVAAAQSAAPTPPWAAALDSMMQRELARMGTPGAQIAVVSRGRLVYTRGYGVADVETGRPVTERTLFQIGSVTKLVTATLLAQLAAEGKVDLQAPISRYVPELAGRRAAAATTHQLLTHSAGWRDYGNAHGSLGEDALGNTLRTISDTMVMTEPGRVYSYSNPGFSMAGYVAERATGRPFVDLVDSAVLRRLGMPRATFRPTVAMTYDFSLGHAARRGEAAQVVRPMPVNSVDVPSGFLYASAAELARLAMALMGGGTLDGQRVLSADAVRAITTGYVPVPGDRFARLGYGMRVDSAGGRRVWQKNGSVEGFVALLTMWPDEQLAVVVMGNRVTDLPARATAMAAQIAGGIAPPPAVVYKGERDATPSERAQLVGTYQLGNAVITLADTNGALQMRLPGRLPGPPVPARLTSDGSRLVVGEPADGAQHPYVIVRDHDGRVRYLHRDNGRTYARQP